MTRLLPLLLCLVTPATAQDTAAIQMDANIVSAAALEVELCDDPESFCICDIDAGICTCGRGIVTGAGPTAHITMTATVEP